MLEPWKIAVISVCSFLFVSIIAGGIYYYCKRTSMSNVKDEETLENSVDETTQIQEKNDIYKIQQLEDVAPTALSPPHRHHYSNRQAIIDNIPTSQHSDLPPLRLFSQSPLHKAPPSTQSSVSSTNNTESIYSHRTITPFQGYTYNGPTPPWTQFHSDKTME